MNRFTYAEQKPIRGRVYVCLVSWSTWSEVCDFLPSPVFNRGVYLDENGNATDDGGWKGRERMGVLVNSSNGVILVKEKETIYYSNGIYTFWNEKERRLESVRE